MLARAIDLTTRSRIIPAACTCAPHPVIPPNVATLAIITTAVRRFTTVTTVLRSARNFGSSSARYSGDSSNLSILFKLSTRHDNGTKPVITYTPVRSAGPPESGVRPRPEAQPLQAQPRSASWNKSGLSDDVQFLATGLPALLEPLKVPPQDNRTPRPEANKGASLVRRDSSKMASSVQIITSPTADTPGTTLMLQTQKQHYIFGTHAEGTQRAMVEQGLRMTKVQNFFMTGKMDWQNAGGLIGMTLTLADSATSAYDMAMEVYRKGKGTKKLQEPQRPKINVYGPPNLKHALNTCRRYIFRKGIPVIATEYKDVPIHKNDQGAILPTWQDNAIQVWALCTSPARKCVDPDREQQLAKLQDAYERYANNFEEHQAPENESAEQRDARYDRIRSAVLNLMFNSKWTLDTLVERHISDVEPPAAIFVRNSETNRIEAYRGPKPGSGDPLPDIKVLTRTPWPGATITGLPPTAPKAESLSYIVRSQSTRGTFDAKRAREFGLKPGPDFGMLSKGQSVQNNKGETITPHMVIGPDKPGNGFAILDVPLVDYLETLIQREEFMCEDLTKDIKIFYWALGPGVSGHPLLQQFLERFNHAEHFFSSVDDCPNRISLDSVAAQTIRLSAIDPARYRIPQQDVKTLPQTSLYGLGSPGKAASMQNVTPAVKGIKHILMPKFERKVDEATEEEKFRSKEEQETPDVFEMEVRAQMDPKVLKLAEEAQQAVKNDHEALSRWRQLIARPDTEVVTLGTGSACPSKYRNVSATLLRVPGVGNYLFDCGEGTLGQLQRVFNTDELVGILKDLRMIWISHLHADHHLGTASVIREWYKLKHNSVPQVDHPSESTVLADNASKYGLSVISHEGMIKWLREYSLVEDFGHSRILPLEISAVGRFEDSGSRLTFTSTAASGQMENRLVLQQKDYEAILGLSDMQACRVSHCHGAMAVSLTFPRASADPENIKPLKVSYSGDCRPAHTFTLIGRNSTILIHEATFDDELKGDAIAKKHSTTSEALGIGAQMNAKAVVLTHFSQRYQKIPVLQTVQDGEQDDLPDPNAMEDVQQDDGDNAQTAPTDAAVGTSALPSDSARPPASLSKAEGSTAHEQVIKVRSKDMKVAIAFDYMRVKIGEIAQLEKFNEALNRLLTAEEEAEVPGSEGVVEGVPVINSNGKKTSGDEGGGWMKKKSKRNN
ncbi:uncharacterized protein N0V89_000912 [Didymosphaeria variabile]|uniref:ribonuclease Z n=1 Tax=Didymosphaeria variabile TaxID=1932322 RepID=A0A9W9CGA2_9PLEO|nr:uncharacterized protein N0V89_000912 [Didymosphaeria variabile]KAJ4360350.1 hypothetical protein N0V89_000912 [Didymosphaeria variabile]